MNPFRKLWKRILNNGNTFINQSVLDSLRNSDHTVDYSFGKISIQTFLLVLQSFPKRMYREDLIFLISPNMENRYMEVLRERSTVSYDMYTPMLRPTPFGILTIPVIDFPDDKLVLSTLRGTHVVSSELGKKYEIDRISLDYVYGYNISLHDD